MDEIITDPALKPAPAQFSTVYTVYRKRPGVTNMELLLTSNDLNKVNNFMTSHDWDNSYETLLYANGVYVERGRK